MGGGGQVMGVRRVVLRSRREEGRDGGMRSVAEGGGAWRREKGGMRSVTEGGGRDEERDGGRREGCRAG